MEAGISGTPLHSPAQPLLDEPAPAVAVSGRKPAESAAALKARKLSAAIIYGIINGIVGLPTMVAFADIIYKVLQASKLAPASVSAPACSQRSHKLLQPPRIQSIRRTWGD